MSGWIWALVGVGGGGLVAFVLTFIVHERREFARQDERERRATERHETLMQAVRDMRALALGAINQRASMQRQVDDHENRIVQVEKHLGFTK
jgi:hypothetical protein